MGDGQFWILLSHLVKLFDFNSYNTKDWLQLLAAVLAIFGYTYGLWKAFRFSKRQIAKRLLEYLEDDGAAIKDVRKAVVRHMRYGNPLPKEPNHPFFQDLKVALADLDRGETTQAERQFSDIVTLEKRYTANANLQMATVLLVVGQIASRRSENGAARTAWETALHCNPEDAEASRYLGELALAAGEAETAWEHFVNAEAFSPDDKRLKAETSELKAQYYRERRNPRLELGALLQCAPNFSDIDEVERAATAYARAGELAGQLGRNVQGPRLLRQAFEHYHGIDNREGMATTRKALEDLGEDVSNLPRFEQTLSRKIPWFWIRLALELALLGAATYLIFMAR